MNTSTQAGKILKFADQLTKFPKKERFNQDLNASIEEIKNKMSESSPKQNFGKFLNANMEISNSVDGKSHISRGSKLSSVTKSNLKKYFKEKQANINDDTRSRMSAISRGNYLTDSKKFKLKKLDKEVKMPKNELDALNTYSNSNTLGRNSPEKTYD